MVGSTVGVQIVDRGGYLTCKVFVPLGSSTEWYGGLRHGNKNKYLLVISHSVTYSFSWLPD